MSNQNNVDHHFDFENLFDSSFLDQITSDLIKDAFEPTAKIKNSVTSLTSRILNYIHEKIENGHHEIKYSKFYDHLISIGCDAEDINEGFEFLDFTYNDYISLEELNNYLSSAELKTKRFSIELYLKKLRLTSLLPGFIDAYVDENLPNSYELLHQKLFKFLLSHRLPSNLINPKKIEHQINNLNLRRKFLIIQEDKYDQTDGMSSNQMILKTEQCIKSIRTCCADQKTIHLLDNQGNTYWESKNSECDPHSILIHLKENISAIRLYLAFYLTKEDSFKAQFIEISVSEDANAPNKRFHLISTCKIQTSASSSIMLESESTNETSSSETTSSSSSSSSSSNGLSTQNTCNTNQENTNSSYNLFSTAPNEFLLCDSFPKNQNYSFIKINIKASNSSVIRVKSIRLLGVKRETNKQQTVKDASICWFFDILSSMALMQSQVMPSMSTNLLNISKSALANMPPLSICGAGGDSSETFLSETVLAKVDSFLKSLISFPHHTKQECSQAVMIYLEFNLARGCLKNILYSLNWILENSQLSYDFRELIPKLDTVSELCVRKTADHLKLNIIYVDGMPSEKNANKPSFLLENNTNQQIYMTDSSVKRFNLVLKSEKFITITSLFMKIQRGVVGVKNFLLFFILNDKEPNVSDFNKFNNFTKSDYDAYKNQNNEEDKNFKMVYFEFLDKQTEAEFELPLVYRVRYVVIKFLRPKDANADRLGIMHLKFNGCTYDNVDIYNQFSVIKYASSLNPHSGAMLVCAILWFLCQLAEKHKTLSRMQREAPAFINFEEFQINDLWKLYETILNEYEKQTKQPASPHNKNNKIQTLRIPILCLLYELVNCAEIKSLNYTFNLNRKVLDYLINLINSEIDEKKKSEESGVEEEDEQLEHIKIISKYILLSGIDVFFPTFELRKQCLILMLEMNTPSEKNSVAVAAAATVASVSNETNFNDYLINITNKKSSNLLFEAFCNLFYNAKASLLIDLSVKNLLNYSLNDAESTKRMLENFNLISKVIELSLNPATTAVKSSAEETEQQKYTIINKLLNKIQSYVCYKCRKLLYYLANPNEQQCFGDASDQEFIKQIDLANNSKLKKRLKNSIELFLANYTRLLINKIELFLNKSENLSLISYLNTETFLILTLHHYILWLIELVNVFRIRTCATVLNLILDIEKLLNRINFIESVDETTTTTVSGENTDENLLRVWYIDTKTYSTLNNLNIDFNCIGATRYHVIFDDLCEIKNNIDLFEFIDSDEEHHTCNGYKVGCETWKKELNMNSRNYLKFNLITHRTIVPLEENINIKFTCKAYGYGSRSGSDPAAAAVTQTKSTSNSINELRTSITCLVGIYCSHIYTQRLSKFESTATRKTTKVEKKATEEHPVKTTDGEVDEVDVKVEEAEAVAEAPKIEHYYYFDFNSYLYKTLLRGGLIEVNSTANNKLIRSYSGIHESIGMNDKMHRFLINLIENSSDSEFLKLYETHFEKVKRPKIGGVRVNKAILGIFAALLWHTPVIKRNDLVGDEDEDETVTSAAKTVNDHIAQAYKAAESMRMIIVEQQQLSKLTDPIVSPGGESVKEGEDSENEEENHEDFIDMITKKAIYLLKISRLSKIPMKNELYNDYDDIEKCNLVSKSRIKKSHHHHSSSLQQQQKHQHSTASTAQQTTTVRIPKYDSYPTFNLILEFIFDKLINLKSITKILNTKKKMSKLISEAFKLAKEYLEINISGSNTSQQQQLECVLTFLSCFFNLKPHQYGIHYLQNLYGCGLNLEKLVREAYYEFLTLIFNFIKKYQVKHEEGSITAYELDTYIRLNSYLLHFFNIDWELYDWKFISDISLDKFLIRNCYLNLPLTKHEYDASDANSKKPMEILEAIFDINTDVAADTATAATGDESSFDHKIYPKLYKQHFGASSALVKDSSSKRFNTEELIDCLSREAVTPEQKLKFHIARYMAWKYFYKLKVNFTCDICDILLVGNRYQCIDCPDFSMCFTCFSKSCVDFNSTYTKMKGDDEEKGLSIKKESEQHKPEHRVLLLDHCCDNCGALIVGKRIHCDECDDYDLCLMCNNMLQGDKTDAEVIDTDLEAVLNTSQQPQHNKSHKLTVLEPNIYHGKSLKNSNLQLYTYLHSQILFSILSLKLSRLLAYSSTVSSQEKASLMINDDLVYYKDINMLHSSCLRLIIKNLNHIYSPKVFVKNDAAKQKLEIFATYSQEILMGLLTTIIQSNTVNLVDNTTTKFDIQEIVSALYMGAEDHVFTLYELIAYLITIIIKRNDHYYEENLIYMVINALIKLLEYSEPHKVDLLIYYLNNDVDTYSESLELEIGSRVKAETGFHIEGELSLDYIVEWINQGVQCAQIDLIYNYIKLICKLCSNKNWKPAVDSLINRLLDTLLESTTEKSEEEQKILNFLCALIFTPVIVYVGQWIECKSDDEVLNQSNNHHNDDGLHHVEFKNALLKNQCYDETNKGFNLAIVDLISRNYIYLKGLQNDLNFRKSQSIAQYDTLQLNLDSCSKLIKLYKKLLTFNTLPPTTTPSGSSAIRYANFKQLTLKHNLILLCITILLKDYQSKYAEYLQKQKTSENHSHMVSSTNSGFYLDSQDDEENLKKLFIDYDFIRLVSEIAHLGTNLDSDWQLQHLQTYLFRLLMKEGFNNLNDETGSGSDECGGGGGDSELLLGESTETSAKKSTKKSREEQKTQQAQQQQLANRTDKGLESIDTKTKINFIDRLKLDLTSYAVIGIDDTLNNYLCDNQDKQDNKLNKRIYNKRIRKSFKLLKEATDKMISRLGPPFNSDLNQLVSVKTETTPTNKAIVTKTLQQNTSTVSAESSSLSTISITSVIKQVNIASLVLNSRELLIFLVNNWPKNSETITASHLNCKNETDIIEFLYLLYNSIDINKYKLIVHNIVSLLDVSSLAKICLLASNYLLPDYRFIKLIDWKSDMASTNDNGELKKNAITKVVSGGVAVGSKKAKVVKDESESIDQVIAEATSDVPSSSPIATLDYTLLIVFDLDKLKINSSTSRNSVAKLKKKYKNFKKQVNLALVKSSSSCKEGEAAESEDDDVTVDPSKTVASDSDENNEDNDEDNENEDEEEDDEDDDDDDDDRYRIKIKKKSKKLKKNADSLTKLLFFVGESRHSNETDEDEDDDDGDHNDDDDDDDDEDDDDDDSDEENEEDAAEDEVDSERSSTTNLEDNLWQFSNLYNDAYDDECDMSDSERRKRKFKMPVRLHNIRDPYISIRNRSLKWKFVRGEKSGDAEQCAFRIYSCTTQTFDSAFILLSEIFTSKSMHDLPLNELWMQLVKISCLMTYARRLKIVNLLIKIIEHVLKSSLQQYPVNYLNLFALKPLRSLLCSLASYKEGGDTDSLRALYELFFYAEKLVIKWSIHSEYMARLKSKNELVERLVDVAMRVGVIEKAILSKTVTVASAVSPAKARSEDVVQIEGEIIDHESSISSSSSSSSSSSGHISEIETDKNSINTETETIEN